MILYGVRYYKPIGMQLQQCHSLLAGVARLSAYFSFDIGAKIRPCETNHASCLFAHENIVKSMWEENRT